MAGLELPGNQKNRARGFLRIAGENPRDSASRRAFYHNSGGATEINVRSWPQLVRAAFANQPINCCFCVDSCLPIVSPKTRFFHNRESEFEIASSFTGSIWNWGKAIANIETASNAGPLQSPHEKIQGIKAPTTPFEVEVNLASIRPNLESRS